MHIGIFSCREFLFFDHSPPNRLFDFTLIEKRSVAGFASKRGRLRYFRWPMSSLLSDRWFARLRDLFIRRDFLDFGASIQ